MYDSGRYDVEGVFDSNEDAKDVQKGQGSMMDNLLWRGGMDGREQ